MRNTVFFFNGKHSIICTYLADGTQIEKKIKKIIKNQYSTKDRLPKRASLTFCSTLETSILTQDAQVNIWDWISNRSNLVEKFCQKKRPTSIWWSEHRFAKHVYTICCALFFSICSLFALHCTFILPLDIKRCCTFTLWRNKQHVFFCKLQFFCN